jgi:hypothetical protein
MSRAETLAQLEAHLAKPGGKQALRFAMNAIGGAIPFAGGVVSGAGSLWAEREQGQTSGTFFEWAKLADGEIVRINEALASLLAEPSPSSMALLLGAVLGDGVTSQLLPDGDQVAVVLNPTTAAELEPYIAKGWLGLKSTGAICSMGANNRVGNHIEELKRPYGLGNGFVLTVAPQVANAQKRNHS